jgi:tetratricopeptide (TPR) repeat protein
MPFGTKPDPSGRAVNFDAVYKSLIAPAISRSGLEPIRADSERTGGIIQKAMFERLILCEFAVADLTTGNPNVFYELGVRHAVRPYTTILLFAKGNRLPFDVEHLRAIPYELGADGRPANLDEGLEELAGRIESAKSSERGSLDSPLFQLLEDYPNIDHTKTDVFRELVDYSSSVKEKLSKARASGRDEVAQVEREVGELDSAEAGISVDLLLSYRAVSAWEDMIRLVSTLPRPLRETALIQEQLAFALNRSGREQEAEETLRRVIQRHGASSETYGLLGRVYKDRWEAAKKSGDHYMARGFLEQAIEAYVLGFESDWRDAYPGVNAVTLMEFRSPPDSRQSQLLPVVRYSAQRKAAGSNADYWDFATLLELAILSRDETEAFQLLGRALSNLREGWEAATTARNIGLLCESMEARDEVTGWAREIESQLLRQAEVHSRR